MRKLMLFAVLLAVLPCATQAQILDFNGNVVAGVAVDTDKDPVGNRADFMLSLNVTGFRIRENLYFGGVGADAGTIANVLGNITTVGLSVTVPAVTFYPTGGQWMVQTGMSQAILGPDPKPFRAYVAAGWGFTSPQRIAYKRALKKAKAAKAKAPPCPPSVCPVAK